MLLLSSLLQTEGAHGVTYKTDMSALFSYLEKLNETSGLTAQVLDTAEEMVRKRLFLAERGCFFGYRKLSRFTTDPRVRRRQHSRESKGCPLPHRASQEANA